MNLLSKVLVGTSIVSTLAVNLVAKTYIVKNGDTLSGIVEKLGFSSIEQSGLIIPSGDINLIFPGDHLEYRGKKKRKFKTKAVVDLKKFCFRDNRSIHYRANERCK